MVKKILIYAEIDWDFLEQRHHYVARFFRDAGYEVVFFQRVVGRIPRSSEILNLIFTQLIKIFSFNKKLRNLERDSKSILLKRAYFLPDFNILCRFYNIIYWLFSHKSVQKNNIIYSFSNNPAVHGYGRSEAIHSIFDIIHNWWRFPWHSDYHKRSVDLTLHFFDRVITDSVKIKGYLSSRNIHSTLMLPGLSESWLKNFPLAEAEIPKPCFFGNLRANSDLSLVLFFHLEFGVKIFGRIDQSVEDLSRCFPDVVSLGNSDLPEAVSQFNIILLPYTTDEFSETISPAKYFEALSTGSLIVTRSCFDHLPGGREFVFRWRSEWNSEMFLSNLLKRLKDQKKIRSQQIAFASEHSWDSRFLSVFGYLMENDDGCGG